MRYRQRLIEDRADEVRRLQKVLEGGNIKLGDVATDVLGKSGRMMLEQLASGETDSDQMAGLAQGKLRTKRASLSLALEGSVGPHQRFMLKRLLEHIEFLEGEIDAVSQEIEARMRPFEPVFARLEQIPGIGRRNAQRILAEIGLDMRYWRNDKAFASWAKLCPGNNESAGKRRSSWIGAGNQFLRGALVEAAQAAARAKDSYFSALYHRLKAKRGAKRALIAVAHAILVTIYHLLKDGTTTRTWVPTTSIDVIARPWSDATSDVSSFSATTSASAPLHDCCMTPLGGALQRKPVGWGAEDISRRCRTSRAPLPRARASLREGSAGRPTRRPCGRCPRSVRSSSWGFRSRPRSSDCRS